METPKEKKEKKPRAPRKHSDETLVKILKTSLTAASAAMDQLISRGFSVDLHEPSGSEPVDCLPEFGGATKNEVKELK